MLQPDLKCSLHWAGSALALAGIALVALRLCDYGNQIDFGRFNLYGSNSPQLAAYHRL